MSIALLIVDMQEAFFKDEDHVKELKKASQYINEVSKHFREKKQPVIHIQHSSENFKEGVEGYEVSKNILQNKTDIYIPKTQQSGFYKTDLEKILHKLNVELVIVSGYAVPYCVLSTYIGADERGFSPSMLQNGIVGIEPNHVHQMYDDRDIINYKAVQYMLKLL